MLPKLQAMAVMYRQITSHKHHLGPAQRTIALPLLLLCISAACPEARGDIYMYTDDSRTINFSNVPTDERYELTLKTEQLLDSEKFVLQKSAGIKLLQQKKFAPEISAPHRHIIWTPRCCMQ